jgi:hypothetical protein
MFDFYVAHDGDRKLSEEIEAWRPLVHVCQNWRRVAFGSPHRLGLQLLCNARTPVRETLDAWPPLPITIRVFNEWIGSIRNIIAALRRKDDIREIKLWRVPSSQLEGIVDFSMQEPFPALVDLCLEPGDDAVVDVPASFLGGSAPRLQKLSFYHISFPALPRLLLSAIHLVRLQLWGTPHSSHISPLVIVNCLSVMTKLEVLHIGFKSARCRFNRKSRRPHPPTRTLLPVLTELNFRGVNKYLEDLVARVDAPLLRNLDITYFHQQIFDTPQQTRFIRRTPNFKANDDEHQVFSNGIVSVTLPQNFDGVLKVRILESESD